MQRIITKKLEQSKNVPTIFNNIPVNHFKFRNTIISILQIITTTLLRKKYFNHISYKKIKVSVNITTCY